MASSNELNNNILQKNKNIKYVKMKRGIENGIKRFKNTKNEI